ncbi:hypothetical protein JTB14_021867 [Gonioctena quinquepunctata]|nr:hypothetical protein JTB14_021867 [Gonioctena quinquepunctata]
MIQTPSEQADTGKQIHSSDDSPEAMAKKPCTAESQPSLVKVEFLHQDYSTTPLKARYLESFHYAILTAVEDIPDGGPQEGAFLKCVTGDELPRPHIRVGYIPDEGSRRLSPEQVLTRLRKMNHGSTTLEWTILHKEISGPGQTWNSAIDDSSMAELERLRFKPYFGFGQTYNTAKAASYILGKRFKGESMDLAFLSNISGLLTGHCRLNHHKLRLGLTENPACRLCLEDDETSEHIFCACPAADRIRFSTFGEASLLPSKLKNHSPVDVVIPVEQAGFRSGRSCTDQVLSLTTHIGAGFERGLRTSVAFIDLTAAYDTVWREGLIYKLPRVIPCLKMCHLINNLLTNRLFQVFVNDAKSSTRKPNNGLPQGLVLAPLLFNLYPADLPKTRCRKFAYADDLAISYQH